jgi:hypothetical protein
MAAFLFLPDRGSVSDKFSFSTVIFSSFNLTESRKQLLASPKYKTSFNITVNASVDIGRLKAALYSAEHDVQMPVWSRGTLTDYASSPTGSITFSKGHALFPGETILITNVTTGGNSVVFGEVTSASAFSVNITPDLSFDKGALVIPYKIGVLSTSLSSESPNGMREKFAVSFEEL